MTKIFEALEQYELAQSADQAKSAPLARIERPPLAVSDELRQILVGLYYSICPSGEGPARKVVQFIETSPNSGCAKLLRSFAEVVVRTLHKSVLLLTADPQQGIDFDLLDSSSRRAWCEEIRDRSALSRSPHHDTSEGLYVSRLTADGYPLAGIEESQLEDFLLTARRAMDLILIDALPRNHMDKAIVLSSGLDGVVLVVEAGTTRWQSAERLKREVLEQGAEVLGVLLNKRTYPIPGRIYQRL